MRELFVMRKELEDRIKNLKTELELVEDRIAEELSEELKDLDTGTVHLEKNGLKLVVVTPKVVKWDSELLADVYKSIEASGENPLEYIDVEYGVPETRYKSWPEHIRKVFEGARTVKPGKRKITLTEGGEDAT